MPRCPIARTMTRLRALPPRSCRGFDNCRLGRTTIRGPDLEAPFRGSRFRLQEGQRLVEGFLHEPGESLQILFGSSGEEELSQGRALASTSERVLTRPASTSSSLCRRACK